MLRADSFDDERENQNSHYTPSKVPEEGEKLGLRATAKLSLEFCLLWVCPEVNQKLLPWSFH